MINTGRAFLAFSVSIFVLSAASLYSAAADRADTTAAQSAVQSAVQSGEEAKATDRYVIRSTNGRVVLFDASGTVPIRELDISYNDLPPEDRALLDSGLQVDDVSRLLALIEDYTG